MLWDIIREFFVLYVFGGYLEDGNSYGGLWGGPNIDYNTDLEFQLFGHYTTLGDYLSNIATIITMVAILLFCIFIVKKIIGVMFRLFTFGA